MKQKDKNSFLLSALILIQPLLDIVSYFAIEAGMTSITTMIRAGLFAVVLIYAYTISEKKKVYYILAAVLGIYWVIHMMVCARNGYQSFISDLNTYIRTIQMPALTIAFITLFKRSNKYPKKIGMMFSINYVIIALSIILSFAVNKPVYTYHRWIGEEQFSFGIKGWFYTGNSQSAILSVMAMLAMYDAYRKKNNLYFVGISVLSFLLMYLFGTRVCYLAIFVTAFSFLIIMLWNREKRLFVAAALIIAVVVVGIGYKASPCAQRLEGMDLAVDRWETSIQNGENVHVLKPTGATETTEQPSSENLPEYQLSNTPLKTLEKRFGYKAVLQAYGNSLEATELVDQRLMKTAYCDLLMQEGDLLDQLFGLEYQDFVYEGQIFDPENDFPAIYYSYGVVGFFLYIAFLLYFVILLARNILKDLRHLPMEKVLVGLSLILILGTAQFSANVLRRPNVSIFLSLFLAYIYYLCKLEKDASEFSA